MKIKKFASIIFLVMLINWSCAQSGEQKSSENEQVPQKEQVKEQVKVPEQQKTPSEKVDKFGRKPGDAHYGHNHASNNHSGQKNDSIKKPASGEPDKFGRKPGDPHYGHNHE